MSRVLFPHFSDMKTEAHREAALSKVTQVVIGKVGPSGFHVGVLESDALEDLLERSTQHSAQALVKSWKKESESEACYPAAVGPRALHSELSSNLICWGLSECLKGRGLSLCPSTLGPDYKLALYVGPSVSLLLLFNFTTTLSSTFVRPNFFRIILFLKEKSPESVLLISPSLCLSPVYR